MVAEGFDKPNGLAFSPDERVLYVGDSGEGTHHIEAFDVVDGHALAGGELVFLVRPDAAQVASVQVTTDKARTAAIYRRPSKDFEDQASGGRPSALHLARAVPLQGGMPIEYAGESSARWASVERGRRMRTRSSPSSASTRSSRR